MNRIRRPNGFFIRLLAVVTVLALVVGVTAGCSAVDNLTRGTTADESTGVYGSAAPPVAGYDTSKDSVGGGARRSLSHQSQRPAAT